MEGGGLIPMQQIKRMREALYMVYKSRFGKRHGAGIELVLEEKTVRIHGSSLKFKSDGKSGTTVMLCLKFILL